MISKRSIGLSVLWWILAAMEVGAFSAAPSLATKTDHGFVFTSLIGLIGAQIATRHPLDFTLRSYRPLIAAFLGLVATSLNYAIIAGEEGKKPRVAQLEIVAGLGFCAAATMAFG